MRLLGLALLVFIIAGAAAALSMFGLRELSTRAGDLFNPPELRFEEAAAPAAARGDTASVLRAWPRQPIVLSGLPAYQGASFALPVDARPRAGVLHVEATSQVAAHTDALLRVSIGNTRRAEVLLPAGTSRRHVEIPLSALELSAGQVSVSYSLQGSGPNAVCAGDGVGAVVQITPETRIELVLDRPLDSPRDRAIGWGSLARVAWTQDLGAAQQDRQLALAASLMRNDVPVQFWDGAADEALAGDDLAQLLMPAAALPLRGAPQDSAIRFPLALADHVGPSGLRRFQRSTTWRSRIAGDDLPEGEVPGALDLALDLGPLPEGAHWTVSVALNGQLVSAETTGAGAYTRQLALPVLAARKDASLEISAISSYETTGACNDGPELLATLRDSSRITGAPARASALQTLRDAITDRGLLQVHAAAPLTAPEATRAALLLIEAAAPSVTLASGRDTAVPLAHALPGLPDAALLDGLLAEPGQSLWLIWSDPQDGTPRLQAIAEAHDLSGLPGQPVMLLVSIPDRDLALGDPLPSGRAR